MDRCIAKLLVSTPPLRLVALAPFAPPDRPDVALEEFLVETTSRLCSWLAQASQRGPLPPLQPVAEVAPGVVGRTADELLADLQLVMDGSYRPSHPGALAHLDPPLLTASIAADLVCAGLNNNLLAEELSPSLSMLERQLTQWFALRLGLPEGAGGVAASGGSLSNLMALVTARHWANLDNNPRAVVITGEDAHVSLLKACRVMGLLEDGLQTVSCDSDGCLDPCLLEQRLHRLRDQDRPCLAVVATAGTTVRGAIDPISPLANLCRREGIWLHVDAAIGGIFALSPRSAHLLTGINCADSATVNPQKLLGITKTSSLLLVARPENLAAAFTTGLPYMEPSWSWPHGGELGLQGSRPAEILKLWLGLRQLGEVGIRELLEAALERRRLLQQCLDASRFLLLSGPLHLLACSPAGIDVSQAEAWSITTRQILLSHHFMLSRPVHYGRHYLKVVLGNPHTRSYHLHQLANLLNASIPVSS